MLKCPIYFKTGVIKINEEKKDDDLLKKVNNMMHELTEIKRKLQAQ